MLVDVGDWLANDPQCSKTGISDESTEIDFEMRLKRWSRNYIILLKLAEMELSEPDRTRQINRTGDIDVSRFYRR